MLKKFQEFGEQEDHKNAKATQTFRLIKFKQR